MLFESFLRTQRLKCKMETCLYSGILSLWVHHISTTYFLYSNHKELSLGRHHFPKSPTDKGFFLSVPSPQSFFLIQLHVSGPVFFIRRRVMTSHPNLSKSQHSPCLMCGPPQLWWLQRQQWPACHNNSRWELEGWEEWEGEQECMNWKTMIKYAGGSGSRIVLICLCRIEWTLASILKGLFKNER